LPSVESPLATSVAAVDEVPPEYVLADASTVVSRDVVSDAPPLIEPPLNV